MALNPKQQAFVREYLTDYNATQAAKRAGYSPKSAYSQGHDLLKHPDVAAAIEEGKQAASAKFEITREFVGGELRKIALAQIGDVSPSVRVRALEVLGKIGGLMNEPGQKPPQLNLIFDIAGIAPEDMP